MNPFVKQVSPNATRQILTDHARVLANFHKFRPDGPPQTKQAIAELVCTALEIHAALEEEIFYPALRELDPENSLIAKSVPEHDDMRRLIQRLRGLHADEREFDDTFLELMRDVMHHVADEETTLLPAAERLLADRLDELGAQMMRRRLQLAGPHAGEIALNTGRAMPASTMAMAGGALVVGAWVLKRALERRAKYGA